MIHVRLMALMAQDPEAFARLERAVGQIILRLPAAAKLLRHTDPASTVTGNYVKAHDDESEEIKLAAEFVNDLFRRPLEEQLARWYPDGDERILLGAAWGDGPEPRPLKKA